MCHKYYAELVVASFSHKIQSEYYDGNSYVSIEGIALEHFSATYKEIYSLSLYICTYNTAFHSFLNDQSKQDSATTDAHRKIIMELLKTIYGFWSQYSMG